MTPGSPFPKERIAELRKFSDGLRRRAAVQTEDSGYFLASGVIAELIEVLGEVEREKERTSDRFLDLIEKSGELVDRADKRAKVWKAIAKKCHQERDGARSTGNKLWKERNELRSERDAALKERDELQSSLERIEKISEKRLSKLLLVSEEKRLEWIRAENAEAERDAAIKRAELAESWQKTLIECNNELWQTQKERDAAVKRADVAECSLVEWRNRSYASEDRWGEAENRADAADAALLAKTEECETLKIASRKMAETWTADEHRWKEECERHERRIAELEKALRELREATRRVSGHKQADATRLVNAVAIADAALSPRPKTEGDRE